MSVIDSQGFESRGTEIKGRDNALENLRCECSLTPSVNIQDLIAPNTETGSHTCTSKCQYRLDNEKRRKNGEIPEECIRYHHLPAMHGRYSHQEIPKKYLFSAVNKILNSLCLFCNPKEVTIFIALPASQLSLP